MSNSHLIAEHHRGVRMGEGRPNSFEAFTRSKSGDVFEMDVFLLADGNLALVHHKDLGLPEEEVEKMDIDDFQQIENPRVLNEGQARRGGEGPRMPLLDEAIMHGYDRGFAIQIELKASSIEKIRQLCDKVLEKIAFMKQEGVFKKIPEYLDRLSFMAFSVEGAEYATSKTKEAGLPISAFLAWPSSEKYAEDMAISATAIEHAKQVGCGDWFERGISVAAQRGIAGIAIFYKVLLQHPEYILEAHGKGLQVMATGMTDNPVDREKLKELGVVRCISEQLE